MNLQRYFLIFPRNVAPYNGIVTFFLAILGCSVCGAHIALRLWHGVRLQMATARCQSVADVRKHALQGWMLNKSIMFACKFFSGELPFSRPWRRSRAWSEPWSVTCRHCAECVAITAGSTLSLVCIEVQKHINSLSFIQVFTWFLQRKLKTSACTWCSRWSQDSWTLQYSSVLVLASHKVPYSLPTPFRVTE